MKAVISWIPVVLITACGGSSDHIKIVNAGSGEGAGSNTIIYHSSVSYTIKSYSCFIKVSDEVFAGAREAFMKFDDSKDTAAWNRGCFYQVEIYDDLRLEYKMVINDAALFFGLIENVIDEVRPIEDSDRLTITLDKLYFREK